MSAKKRATRNKIHQWREVVEMRKLKEDLEHMKKEMDLMKGNFKSRNEERSRNISHTLNRTASKDNDNWDE